MDENKETFTAIDGLFNVLKSIKATPERIAQNQWKSVGNISKNAYNVTKGEFVNTLHTEGLIEVDIPSSIGLLNTLSLFIELNKLLGRLYPNNFSLQKDFYIAERYVEQFIKIPIWTFPDESNIIDKYIAGFKKVYDYILENKGF